MKRNSVHELHEMASEGCDHAARLLQSGYAELTSH